MTQIWGMGSCKMGCTSSWSLNLRPKAANIAELDHRFSRGKPLFAVQGISIRGYISHEDDGILDIQLSFAKSLMATWYRIEIVLAIRHSFPTSWACSLQNYLGSTTNGMDTRTFAGLSCNLKFITCSKCYRASLFNKEHNAILMLMVMPSTRARMHLAYMEFSY